METTSIISFEGLAAIAWPSISIGLLGFSILLNMYLIAKSVRWQHFVSLLVSLSILALPLLQLQRILVTHGLEVNYGLSGIAALENIFFSLLFMWLPLLISIRLSSTGGNRDISGLHWKNFGTMNKILLLGGLVLFLSQLIIQLVLSGTGVQPLSPVFGGGIRFGRLILMAMLAGGAALYTLFQIHSHGKTLMYLFFSAPLALLSLLSVAELIVLTQDGSPAMFSVFGLTIFAATASISQIRDYLDSSRQHHNMANELAYLESHDPLTGLENRRRFYEELNALCTAQHSPDSGTAGLHGVLFVDIDYFNGINDSVGIQGGDRILVQISQRFTTAVAEVDSQARLFRTGGDEFGIITSNLSSELDLALLSEQLLQCFTEAFEYRSQRVFLTVSVGIAIFPRDGQSIEMLTSHADQALHEAKLDRDTYRFYTPSMQERAVSRIQLINYLRQAVDRKELSLKFQPQLDITGKLVGAEALLRWNHDILGSVSPREFIPVAEETGLIISIGSWVIQKACETLVDWQEKGFTIPLSVNLSPRQLRDVKLQRTIIRNLREHNLHPSALHLEITENSLIDNKENLIGKLEALSDIGISFSIDDFGTGYSSLSYLKRLPIAAVKIDRSFVIDLPFDNQNSALVQAIISMVKGLGYQVVAEGVDSIEQLNFLKTHGCNTIQGYYHSKPLENENFLNYARGLLGA